ncbi:MAG TPA: hypothetical protein VGQ83_32655 [Polyangia bacterium]
MAPGRWSVALLLWAGLGCATGVLPAEEPGDGGADGPAADARRGDAGIALLPLGAPCTADADCAAAKCLPLVPAGLKACATPCTAQADCGDGADYFCNPAAAGTTAGYCTPKSPVHCMTCAVDADCGPLATACVQPPGDAARSCHVDCALAGPSACPADYTCADVTVGGATRRLCLPASPAACLEAQGGFCDRVTAAQACGLTNESGTCTGQRACDASSQRFGRCSAAVPRCKASCTAPDPAGCQEVGCPGVATTPEHCGTCATACPGAGQPTAEVTCQAPDCTFVCKGEHYDANGDPADGCEITDTPLGNHTQATAVALGSYTCNDGASQLDITGLVPSDQRAHSPAVEGWTPTTGAAPDWFLVHASGGSLCQDDIALTFQVVGSTNPGCYRLTAITSVSTYSCQATSDGSCSFAPGYGSYGDGTDIFITVEKTCAGPPYEMAAFQITGHL